MSASGCGGHAVENEIKKTRASTKPARARLIADYGVF